MNELVIKSNILLTSILNFVVFPTVVFSFNLPEAPGGDGDVPLAPEKWNNKHVTNIKRLTFCNRQLSRCLLAEDSFKQSIFVIMIVLPLLLIMSKRLKERTYAVPIKYTREEIRRTISETLLTCIWTGCDALSFSPKWSTM